MSDSLVTAVRDLQGTYRRGNWDEAALVICGAMGVLAPLAVLIRPRMLWPMGDDLPNLPLIGMLTLIFVGSVWSILSALESYEFTSGFVSCKRFGRVRWSEQLAELQSVKVGLPAPLRRMKLKFSRSTRSIWLADAILTAIHTAEMRPNNSLERSRDR